MIGHRLDVFAAPLIDYYRGREVLLEVDADRPVDVIRDDLRGRPPSRVLLDVDVSRW